MYNKVEFRNRLIEWKRWWKHYSFPHPRQKKRVFILMVDGRYYHGGMVDRFKGIISIYAYCKANNYLFKIHYVYPFQLQDYLLPNQYDWALGETESPSFNSWCARPVIMVGEAEGRRLYGLRGNRQYHCYYNRDNLRWTNERYGQSYRWGDLFRELFRPAPALSKLIIENQVRIGTDYVSVVFRFQRLLGDFDEYGFPELSDQGERMDLINKCLQGILMLKKQHPHTRFLITSDSETFLQQAKQLDDCYIIPGELAHMEYTSRQDFAVHAKSFVDFFMLAGSRKIYSMGTSCMYKTEFPLYAARLNEIPFERILLD